MAYNTNQQNSTKMIPYFLMYNRIEMLNKSILLDRVIILIHKLPLFRESTRIAIKGVQEKMR